jgi:uncharacterized protein (DUF2267 family)
MQYGEFMKDVRERAGIDEDRAEKAVRATLNTLAQRLAGGEPHDLASQLPEELKETVELTTGEGAGIRWDADEFVAKVAAREGCSPEQAREHVRAIFAALRDAVTPGEFDDITSQLDRSYRELLPEGAAAGR